MTLLRLRYLLLPLVGLVIVATIGLAFLLASPVGGMGSLPLLGFMGGIQLVTMLPLLVPFLLFTFVVLHIAAMLGYGTSSTDSTETTAQSTVHDGDAVEVLKQKYSAGDISHDEYERRLRVLLDTEDADDVLDRIDSLADGATDVGTDEGGDRGMTDAERLEDLS